MAAVDAVFAVLAIGPMARWPGMAVVMLRHPPGCLVAMLELGLVAVLAVVLAAILVPVMGLVVRRRAVIAAVAVAVGQRRQAHRQGQGRDRGGEQESFHRGFLS